MIQPERQHRHSLRAQAVHYLDDAGRLPAAGPARQDAFAGSPLQPCLQRRRRRPRYHHSPNQPAAGAVQVPVRRRRHRAARVVGAVQAPGPTAAPGESFDESAAGHRALRRALHDRQELSDDLFDIRDEERLHPPTHLSFEVPLVYRPDLDPPQPVDRGRSVAGPVPQESREPLPADAAGQPAMLERFRRPRVPRRLARLGELPCVAARHEDEPVVVAGHTVAGGLQQAARAGVERGEAPRTAGVSALRVVNLPPHVRGHDELRLPAAERLDAQGLGSAVEQAHALRERPPVLVTIAGRVRGSAWKLHASLRVKRMDPGRRGSRISDSRGRACRACARRGSEEAQQGGRPVRGCRARTSHRRLPATSPRSHALR